LFLLRVVPVEVVMMSFIFPTNNYAHPVFLDQYGVDTQYGVIQIVVVVVVMVIGIVVLVLLLCVVAYREVLGLGT
jgi:hypothetical protein